MILLIDSHPFHYEMENLCRLFFPLEKIQVRTAANVPTNEEITVYTGLEKNPDGFRIEVRLQLREMLWKNSCQVSADTVEKELERRMAILLYSLLAEACRYRPKWGVLTGVRPVKLFGRLVDEMGEEQAVRYFEDQLMVLPEKSRLCRITLQNERKILSISAPESFSLYIAIPFCPTRCSYCSFVSSSVEKTFHLIPKYVELLCEELRHTAKIVSELGLRLDSVYMGGGTPTTLSAEQLETVLNTINQSFDLSACRELTVEAGRPDTITAEKLEAMKTCGVGRISINPQTLNDEVLRAIGRHHTAAQAVEAFELARKHGFDNINMDLIAGLPKDSVESFRNTLKGILSLSPESITVHTLAVKRAAGLSQTPPLSGRPDAEAAETMLEDAACALRGHGYAPYYLYRQSRMVGNLENTGWAKPGFENCYNVFIMEECQSILACGAGAVTKLKDPASDRLERIFNFKYPYEYINRFKEMMNRKDRVKNIYETFSG